jgi:ADP-dependent phosphofructokinase/glucokinase
MFKKKKNIIDNKKLLEAINILSKTYRLFYERTGKPDIEKNPKESTLIGTTCVNITAILSGLNGFDSFKNSEITCNLISVRVDFLNGANNVVNFSSEEEFLNQAKKWYKAELSKHGE